MNGCIYAMYFSPTHTTQTVTRAAAKGLGSKLDMEWKDADLTAPDSRGSVCRYGRDDVLVFGFPVYGGRIPAFLESCMKNLHGDQTQAVVLGVYGNRDYEDALLEAADLLAANGFQVIAAGAFIGEHSMTAKVAAGRPDAQDMKQVELFTQSVGEKILAGNTKAAEIPGQRPYKERGPSAPSAPKTSDACTKCMICVKGCPMGIIDAEDPSRIADGCIRCCACVKSCPVNAKCFDDERAAKITGMLETNFMARKEPVYFL